MVAIATVCVIRLIWTHELELPSFGPARERVIAVAITTCNYNLARLQVGEALLHVLGTPIML